MTKDGNTAWAAAGRLLRTATASCWRFARTLTLHASGRIRGPEGSEASQSRVLQFAAALLFASGVLSLAKEGGSWTNRAGHVLKGTPQSIHGQRVTFLLGGAGKTVSYPISVFLPEEQERLRCRLKDETLPEGLRGAYDFSGRVIKRSRLLSESGGLSEEECQKAVSTAVDAFRKQAASFVEKKQLSEERLELIVRELSETRK